MALYSVNYWGSYPMTNDDCYSGCDFDTWAEAVQEFEKDIRDNDVEYVELDGPGVYLLRRNPNFRPSRDDDSDWRREQAIQAGMAFGCDGYNDVMGW